MTQKFTLFAYEINFGNFLDRSAKQIEATKRSLTKKLISSTASDGHRNHVHVGLIVRLRQLILVVFNRGREVAIDRGRDRRLDVDVREPLAQDILIVQLVVDGGLSALELLPQMRKLLILLVIGNWRRRREQLLPQHLLVLVLLTARVDVGYSIGYGHCNGVRQSRGDVIQEHLLLVDLRIIVCR